MSAAPRLSASLLVLARAPASASALAGPSAAPAQRFKLLFIQRSSKAGFMASAHVFPGGVLDAGDSSDEWAGAGSGVGESLRRAAAFGVRGERGDSVPLRVCAIRELFEETGLLLAQRQGEQQTQAQAQRDDDAAASSLFSPVFPFPSPAAQSEAQSACSANGSSFPSLLRQLGASLDVGRLAPWSRWITPTFEKRRYDTFFYLAALPEPYLSLHSDPREVSSALWLSPLEALTLARDRKIVLPPPTTYILREMEHLSDIEEVFAHVPHRRLPAVLPALIPRPPGAPSTQLHIALPDDPDYPGEASAGASNSNSAASPGSQSPVLPSMCTDTSRWHRMVRAQSSDSSHAFTTIYRPAHQLLHKLPRHTAKL